jgi:hypothetical protein
MNDQVTPMPMTTTTQVIYSQTPMPGYVTGQNQVLSSDPARKIRLDALKEGLKKDKKKYKKNVVIAATTACYFWLPLGLIPAIVVAAVFGTRAATKYDDIHDKKKEIAALERPQYVVVNSAPTPSYAA